MTTGIFPGSEVRYADRNWLVATPDPDDTMVDASEVVLIGAEGEERVVAARNVEVLRGPLSWNRPAGYPGPCPGCGSTSCAGWYKPDGNHLLPF